MSRSVPRDQLLATVVMPAGRYYLGDPCYSVPDHLWMEWLQAANYETADVLDAEVRGHRVLGLSTLYGDGCYPGSDGFEYGVDAGLIGLVPVALVEDEAANPGRQHRYEGRTDVCTVVEFTEPAVCQYERGLLRFGHVTIDTRD